MDKNEKAALDAYRQERKERIAKQAKQNAKKKGGAAAKNAAGKAVKIVISVALCCAIVFASLNFFGVPQQLVGAVTIDGQSYSMAELTLYYMQMFNNTYQTAYSYDSQYGEGYGKMFTGYDISVAPDAQTKVVDDKTTITWDEYFLNEAIDYMATVKRYYALAVDAKLELTDAAKTEIDDAVASFDSIKGDYSVSRFLGRYYGKGVTEKLFREVLEEQQLVAIYQEQRQEELKANHNADEINGVYAKDKTAYDVVGFRWFTIDIESKAEEVSSEVAEEGASVAVSTTKVYKEEAEAKAFIEKVKAESNHTEETFKKVVLETVGEKDKDYENYKKDQATKIEKLDKETIQTNVNKEAANWLFETDKDGNYVRQAGDMKYFVSSDSKDVYIIYATGVPYQDNDKSTDVRHILVKFPETTTKKAETVSGEDTSDVEETTLVSDKVKGECKSEAQSILDTYNNYIKENASGKADENYFAELASKLTDDTGSASNGGLLEGMRNDGQYVVEFEDWAFAEGAYKGQKREPGVTGIIETEYGFHVMYFSNQDTNPLWYNTILDDLVSEDWDKEQTEFEKQFGEDAIERKEFIVKQVRKACLKTIEGYGL